MNPIDFTKDFSEDEPSDDLVRQQSWPCDRAAELELTIDVGRIAVDLVTGGDEVRVEVRHDPAAGGAVAQGIGGLMSWLSSSGAGAQLGAGFGIDPERLAADAVRAARGRSRNRRRAVPRPRCC